LFLQKNDVPTEPLKQLKKQEMFLAEIVHFESRSEVKEVNIKEDNLSVSISLTQHIPSFINTCDLKIGIFDKNGILRPTIHDIYVLTGRQLLKLVGDQKCGFLVITTGSTLHEASFVVGFIL
jgi:hypothetical protein